MLKQGCLTSEMSPQKPLKSCKTPNAMHVLSTPANSSKGITSEVPPLNWDLSMIGDQSVSNINKSDENNVKDNGSVQRSRRKPVPIKSKYMQSAAKRRTPAVGKTPSTVGRTPSANNRSNRQKIEELNREDTFTFDNEKITKPLSKTKPLTPKNSNTKAHSTSRPVTPRTSSRPTIKQSIGSDRKPLRMIAKEVSATPTFSRRTVQNSKDSSVEDVDGSGSVNNPVSLNPSGHNCPKESLDITEVDLQILQHQKLQLMYIVSKLESTQEALSCEASSQLYQMWKVQENLRSDCSVLEREVLVKEYLCEVNEMCISLLPVLTELMGVLPKFDKQFVTLCGMLDSTRHYIETVNIARLDEQQCEEIQAALKQVLEILKCIVGEASDDKENLKEYAEELGQLKECFKDSTAHYTSAVTIADKIRATNDENLFLTATMSKLNIQESEFIF